jgi:preprotein translocase subunit YajC
MTIGDRVVDKEGIESTVVELMDDSWVKVKFDGVEVHGIYPKESLTVHSPTSKAKKEVK